MLISDSLKGESRAMDDKKKKYAYWMRPSLVQEMESVLEVANATSKSDFVCMAVNFYIGYLRQQKNINYLAPVLAGAIKEEVKSLESNFSRLLFQMAVEQSKLNNLISYLYDVDEDSLESLQDFCAREVAQINGSISFEDAYTFQKSE